MKRTYQLDQHWPIFILFVLVVAFFWRTLFLGEMFVTPNLGVGEITIGGLPLRYYLSQQLKSGNLPLWTDLLYTGYPLLAEPTTAAFYPPNLVFYGLLPPVAAFHVNFAFAFLLAGLSTFGLCRLIGFGRLASLLSAIAFVFSGYWTTHLTHNIVIDAIAWFPGELYLLERLLTAKERRAAVVFSLLLGVVLATQFLAGHAQFFVYSLFVLGLYIVFRLWSGAERRGWLFQLLLVGASLVLTVGLSAVQLLPTIEYFRYSERSGGLRSEVIHERPFHLEELVTLVSPNYFGTPVDFTHNPPFPQKGIYWENTAYVGLVGLALAILSLRRFRGGRQRFFVFLLVGSILLAVGGIGPLRGLLSMPPFGFFRIPARFLYFTTFSLAILAGFGLEVVLRRSGIFWKYLAAGLLVGVVVDLFAFGYPFNPRQPADEWLATPRSVEIIREDSEFSRIYNVGLMQNTEENVYLKARLRERGWSGDLSSYRHLLNWVMPNTNLYHHLPQAGGSLALRLSRTATIDFLLRPDILTGSGEVKRITPEARTLLNLMGVKYVISVFALDEESFELVGTVRQQEPGFWVYRNTAALANVSLVRSAEWFSSEEDILTRLLASEFSPLETVLLEDGSSQAFDLPENGSPVGEVLRVERGQDARSVRIEARARKPGFLLLTDTYYPGWKAFVDGEASEIFRANYLFRAVRVPPGEHTIEFRYEPASFRWGLRITMVTVATTLVGLILLTFLPKRKRLNG